MPDISMCLNEECPMRFECYRFTATPSPYAQRYADFKPNKNGNCDDFWPTNLQNLHGHPKSEDFSDKE